MEHQYRLFLGRKAYPSFISRPQSWYDPRAAQPVGGRKYYQKIELRSTRSSDGSSANFTVVSVGRRVRAG